jgi:hypothetical protein
MILVWDKLFCMAYLEVHGSLAEDGTAKNTIETMAKHLRMHANYGQPGAKSEKRRTRKVLSAGAVMAEIHGNLFCRQRNVCSRAELWSGAQTQLPGGRRCRCRT